MKYSELRTIFPELKEVATGVDIVEKKLIITLSGVELVEKSKVTTPFVEAGDDTLRLVKGIGKTVDEALADIAKVLSEAIVQIGEVRYNLPTITL